MSENFAHQETVTPNEVEVIEVANIIKNNFTRYFNDVNNATTTAKVIAQYYIKRMQEKDKVIAVLTSLMHSGEQRGEAKCKEEIAEKDALIANLKAENEQLKNIFTLIMEAISIVDDTIGSKESQM